MENTIKNYPLRSDGAAVLNEFFIGEDDRPAWPNCLLKHWENIKHKCKTNLESWKQLQKCSLSSIEKETMLHDLQVRVYIGSEILAKAKETTSWANNHINKHWPEELRSGECPSALLQSIRSNYYMSVDAKEKASNIAKQWKANRKKQNIDTTDRQLSEKLNEALKGYSFSLTYFPDEWLTWVLYGPPKALKRSEFQKLEMLHLRQVTSTPRELTENELVKEIEKQSKVVRRASRSTKNKSGDDTDNDDDVTATLISQNKGTTHTIVRELKLPSATAISCLDMAINAKTSMVDLLRGRNVNDDRINTLNDDILELLNKKAEEAMKEYERAMSSLK